MKRRSDNTGLFVAGAAVLAVALWDKFFAPPDPTDGAAGQVDPANEDPRPATFTSSQAIALADGIHAALYGVTEDEQVVVDIMRLAAVTADVRLLVNAYAERAHLFSWFAARSLAGAIAAYLSAGDREAINADYRTKAILYQF